MRNQRKVKTMNENTMAGESRSGEPVPDAAPVEGAPQVANGMLAGPKMNRGPSYYTQWSIIVIEYLTEIIDKSKLPADQIRHYVRKLTGIIGGPRYKHCLRVSVVWDSLHNLAVALCDARYFRLASEVYDYVLASVPGKGDSPRPGERSAWYSGGIINMKAHKFANAARLFCKLLQYADSDPRTGALSRLCLENIAECYMEAKDYIEAAPIIARFLNTYAMNYYDMNGRRRACYPRVKRYANKLMRMGYITARPSPEPHGLMSTEYVIACPEASGCDGGPDMACKLNVGTDHIS